MFRIRRAASLVSVIVVLAGLAVLTACSVQKEKEGSNEKVKIQTPVGGLNVDTNADVKDTGLAVYPGAKPNPKPSGDHNSANVNISSSMFGVKVVALEYVSDDSPDKIKDYYKKELAKYGNVLDCENGVKEEGNEVACSDKPRHGEHQGELVVGTKKRQHLVKIEPDGKGTKFALVYVQVRGEEGAL
jgi:uncharacterized protein YfaP (DUF2135 family)